MSKAEDRAKERYWLEPSNIETQKKYAAYVEGYHQAEKDLELTWEDMALVCKIEFSIVTEYKGEKLPQKELFYQEILKRFKDLKEE